MQLQTLRYFLDIAQTVAAADTAAFHHLRADKHHVAVRHGRVRVRRRGGGADGR